jgi:uncharacterized protein YecT (DUF1311 family)
MNVDAASSLDSSEAELRSVVNTLVQRKLVPRDLYNEAEAAWTRFRDLAARLQSSVVEGGSMQSMVFAMEKEDLTRDWIRRLQNYRALVEQALVEGDVDQS